MNLHTVFFYATFQAKSELPLTIFGYALALIFLAAAAPPAQAQSLPPEVEAALARAKVPRDALAAIVVDAAPAASGRTTPLFSHRASEIGRAHV